MFKDLDPILHSQLRLAVVSILINVKEAEFTFLRERTNSTAGNLSVQIQKLKDAGYIHIVKQFKNNYPQTICRITSVGTIAFEEYVKSLQDYLGNGNGNGHENGHADTL
jgi:DNA-binding transcriptional ArsR family regulator